MRLGVFGKVLLALRRAAAGVRRVNATFTLLSVHRARQGVVANEAYLELQGSVDAAWKSLNDFAPALGRGTRRGSTPTCRWRCGWGASTSTTRVGAIDRYLEKEPQLVASRPDFEIAAAADRGAGRAARRAWRASWGGGGRRRPASARSEFESHFATLTHSLNRMRRPLRGESGQIAQRLSDDEETALSMAIALGAAGLAVARRGLPVHAAHAAAARRAARARAAGGGRATTRSGRA